MFNFGGKFEFRSYLSYTTVTTLFNSYKKEEYMCSFFSEYKGEKYQNKTVLFVLIKSRMSEHYLRA